MASKRLRLVLAVASAIPGLCRLQAQDIQLGPLPFREAAHRQNIEQETQTVSVRAGHPDWVELRFRVDPGMHVNSHTPHDDLLLPTTLSLQSSSNVKLGTMEYPPGIPLRLDVGAGDTLSTYQGELRIRLQITAPRNTSLEGTLKYQACDAHSCFPPKTLPVHVTVVAK